MHRKSSTLKSVRVMNGAPVAMDPMNGFTYDATSQSVTLHGTACDQLRMNPSTKVQVVYGCPAPPPIN